MAEAVQALVARHSADMPVAAGAVVRPAVPAAAGDAPGAANSVVMAMPVVALTQLPLRGSPKINSAAGRAPAGNKAMPAPPSDVTDAVSTLLSLPARHEEPLAPSATASTKSVSSQDGDGDTSPAPAFDEASAASALVAAAPATAQARHNATERRRVQKLKVRPRLLPSDARDPRCAHATLPARPS